MASQIRFYSAKNLVGLLPLIYLILNNVDGIDRLPELILLPRVLVETFSKLLDRLVHFPEARGFNLGCIMLMYPN